MTVIVYDYTEAEGKIIMEDYDYNKSDAIMLCNVDLITIDSQDYEIFETKMTAHAAKLQVAVRKH